MAAHTVAWFPFPLWNPFCYSSGVVYQDQPGAGGLKTMNKKALRTQEGVCSERVRYMEDFLQSIRELGTLQTEQARALIEGDPEFCRFDLLIHMANERKDHAKYAWLFHVEEHHC